MRTARPTTGSPLSVFEAGTAPFDPVSSCFCFFGRLDPADPLIARERRNVLPRLQRFCVGGQCLFLDPQAGHGPDRQGSPFSRRASLKCFHPPPKPIGSCMLERSIPPSWLFWLRLTPRHRLQWPQSWLIFEMPSPT